jgi:hypothetical protein
VSTGDCRLCKQIGVDLQESHIIPKWAFRRAGGGNEPPIRITGGVAVQTSQQIREYLLCRSCEGVISKDEDHVSRLAYQTDGTLGLRKLVETRVFADEELRYVSAAELVPHAIARFSASVFWRAHVSTQVEFKGLRLWKSQAEALRRYTRREADLPWGMSLTAGALVGEGDGPADHHSFTIIPPGTVRKGDDSFHQFAVAGLLFNFFTGDSAREQSAICLATGNEPSISLTNWQMIYTLRSATNTILDARPVGRLAKRHPKGGTIRR